MRFVFKLALTFLAIAVFTFSAHIFEAYRSFWLWIAAGTVFGIWKWEFGFLLHGAAVGIAYELIIRNGYNMLWVPGLIFVGAFAISFRKKIVRATGSNGSNNEEPVLGDEHFFAQASDEFDAGKHQLGLFTKAEVEAGGDSKQTRLLYVKYRVGQLQDTAVLSGQSNSCSKEKTHSNNILTIGGLNKNTLFLGSIVVALLGISIYLMTELGWGKSLITSYKKNSVSTRMDSKISFPQSGKNWIVDLGEGVLVEFVPLPAGTFIMGSSDENTRNSLHKVTLTKPFWIAKTEITQAQYISVMNTYPMEFERLKYKHSNYSKDQVGNMKPVIGVNWDEAMSFCAKLTMLEHSANRLSYKYEYTLPTEAQWEYACRAGSTGDYAGDLDAMGWYRDNSHGIIHPVAQKLPNSWGLYDMHGNVAEWCLDSHEYGWRVELTQYEGHTIDPLSIVPGVGRVVRGGRARGTARTCASAYRSGVKGEFGNGFRVVIIER